MKSMKKRAVKTDVSPEWPGCQKGWKITIYPEVPVNYIRGECPGCNEVKSVRRYGERELVLVDHNLPNGKPCPYSGKYAKWLA